MTCPHPTLQARVLYTDPSLLVGHTVRLWVRCPTCRQHFAFSGVANLGECIEGVVVPNGTIDPPEPVAELPMLPSRPHNPYGGQA